MADIRNEARLREACLAIFHDPGLVDSIITNRYNPASAYPLYEIAKKAVGTDIQFDIVDNLTGVTIRSTQPVDLIGSGTFGEVYKDPINNHVYKIIRTPIVGQDAVFQATIRETVIQIILQNITYVTVGGPVSCAPEIYGFYRYRSSSPDFTGFVIEMEAMATGADSGYGIRKFPTTFHSFVSIINAINEKGIIYNHCDVKLNNMMYDPMGDLRLIDFGFSSIRFTFQDTGRLFQLISEDCGWNHPDMVARPLQPAPMPPGYYIQKDIIHFLLTTWSVYGDHIKHYSNEAYNFLIRLVRYYGLSDGAKTLLNMEKPANKNTFTWSYNFNTKTRRYLHNSRQNTLQKIRPNTILAEYATNPASYPPVKPDAIVLLSGIKRALETKQIMQFLPLFDRLENKNISFPGYPPVLNMVLSHRQLPLLQIILQKGVDPNIPMFANVTPLYYVFLNLRDDPDIHKYVKLLIQSGADINKPAGPDNLPILYGVLRLPDSVVRNKILKVLLPYNPDLTFETLGGQDVYDLADDTGDAETLQLIEGARQALMISTAIASAKSGTSAMPGGKRKVRKVRKVRKTRKQKSYRKKTCKQSRK